MLGSVVPKTKLEVIETILAMYPHAHCELIHHNPTQLAIAVILSAQTTDQAVNRITPGLFAAFPTLQDLAHAPLEAIEFHLKSIGLYRAKAVNIQIFAQQVLTRHNGDLPSDFDALVKLAGVGRKTANVIQAVAFNLPALAVDTHVDRVAHRLHLVPLKADLLKTEQRLKRLIPKELWIHAHHAILFFGRYHCQARTPQCHTCPLYAECRFPKKEHFAKNNA
jgi:endonuclease-3